MSATSKSSQRGRSKTKATAATKRRTASAASGARRAAGKTKPRTTAAKKTAKSAAAPKRATSGGEKPKVSVVIVARSQTASLRACLEALKSDGYTRRPSCVGTRREVFVVDCGSGEHTPEVVKHDYPAVGLFRRPDNAGGARSTNMAISASSGQYILLLDPKVRVGRTTVAELVEYLERNLHVAAVSASVRDAAGRPACRPEHFPSVRDEFAREWDRVATRLGVHARASETPEGPTAVDWVPRTCLLVRRDALRQVGFFDDGYSMYFTEADWCRRARAVGWSIHFHPGIQVTSEDTETFRTDALSGWPRYQFDSSRRHYFRKHHGAPAAAVVDVLRGLRRAADATRAVLQDARARSERLGRKLKDKLEVTDPPERS